MLDSLESAIGQIPHGAAVASSTAAILVLQVVALWIAKKRRDNATLKLQVVAGLTILALPVMGALCVHSARSTMLSAMRLGPSAETVTPVSDGISGQLATIPFVTLALVVSVALWVVGFKVARDAQAAPRPSSLWPAALIPLGLLVLAKEVMRWSTSLIREFATLAGPDPKARAAMLRAGLDSSREHLELFGLVTGLVIVGLSVLAGVLAIQAGRRMTVRAARRHMVVSLGVLAVAAVAFIAARPLRAENELPWPPPPEGDELQSAEPNTPGLAGPDPVEWAPVVQVFTDHLELYGLFCTLDDLEEKLDTLRTNFQLLHPDATFDGRANLAASGAVPTATLAAVLTKMQAAEYLHPVFVFTKSETLVRPLIGTLHRVHSTGISVTIINRFDAQEAHDDRGGAEGKLVRLWDFPRYEPLARRMLAVRQTGSSIVLQLDK